MVVSGGAGSVGANSVGVIINGTGGGAQAAQQGSFKKGGNSFHGVGGDSGSSSSGFGYGGPFSGTGQGGAGGFIIVYSIG